MPVAPTPITKGARVKLNERGLAITGLNVRRRDRLGTVVAIPRDPHIVSVQWDGLISAQQWSRDYLVAVEP